MTTEDSLGAPAPEDVDAFWDAWDEKNPDAAAAAPEQPHKVLADGLQKENLAQVELRVPGLRDPKGKRDFTRRERAPKPPPEGGHEVIDGRYGDKRIVPPGVHEMPRAPQRKRSSKEWCSICLRPLTKQERRAKPGTFGAHKHDPEIQIRRRQNSNEKKLPERTRKGALRKRRRQNWRWEGMAGRPPWNGPTGR
jgi:hypothetical protein